jgi:hypothetical protein
MLSSTNLQTTHHAEGRLCDHWPALIISACQHASHPGRVTSKELVVLRSAQLPVMRNVAAAAAAAAALNQKMPSQGRQLLLQCVYSCLHIMSKPS